MEKKYEFFSTLSEDFINFIKKNNFNKINNNKIKNFLKML